MNNIISKEELFLGKVGTYLQIASPFGVHSSAEDERFVDQVVEEYSLNEDQEALLCASITYIRSIAKLIK